MKLERTGVVLLGLLLMVSVVMSFAAAEGVTSGEAIIGDQNQACASCSIPESGVASYVSGSETNLLMEFGIDEPKVSNNQILLIPYSECKDLVNEIMEKAKLDDDTDAIIGLYDLEQYQILLIGRGDVVLEAVYDGESVTTYDLIPELLGEKKVSYSPRGVALDEQNTNEYSLGTELQHQLYSIPVKSPNSSYTILSTYLVKVSRTDEFRNVVQDVIARLHTEGWFYVDYGNSITSIEDHSTWWINSAMLGWRQCEYSTQNTGMYTTLGKHSTHFKFGCFTDRCQMDMWVNCNAWLTTDDGGNTNRWVSLSPDGCIG